MESEFKIVWTDLALEELKKTVDYLETNFTIKEKDKLGDEIERILSIIIHSPNIFPLSDKQMVRKTVILKYNTMYYRVVGNEIQILSFFSNRQNSNKRKI